jgi:DnaK suppressor protein
LARASKGAKASKKRVAAVVKKAAASAGAPAKKSRSRVATKKTAAQATAKRAPASAKAAPDVAKRASKGVAKTTGARGVDAGGGRGGAPDKFLTEQKSALEAERRSYVAQAESLKAEADQMAQEAEPGDVQFDEESGEGGTMNIDRERDLALSAQARAAVEDIDVALGKIANGAYGTCERCGQPIPKARLKALPQARLCVACKSGGLSRR